MSHFAQIDDNNLVVQVIVAEQDFIDSGAVGDPSRWIQTSYNTVAGEHRLGGTPLRKNYASIGYTYKPDIDAFVPPQPYPSWLLDTETGRWQAPMAYPDPERMYYWDEDSESWQEVVEE